MILAPSSLRRSAALLLGCLLALRAVSHAADAAADARQTIAQAIVTEDADEQTKLIASLTGSTDPKVRDLLTAWKEGSIFLYVAPAGVAGLAEGAKVPLLLNGAKDDQGLQAAVSVATGGPLKNSAGAPVRLAQADLDAADTTGDLRLAIKGVLDGFALASPDAATRMAVITQMGLSQNVEDLPLLQARQKIERDPHVRRVLDEAVALIQLKSDDAPTRLAAVKTLSSMDSLKSRDAILQLSRDSQASEPRVYMAAKAALARLDQHLTVVNFFGAIFRGLSTGSVLLVVAVGLAITFGLMGVINMAHGELIAVGAYATYVVQNIFGAGLALSPLGHAIWLPGINAGGALYECYFLVAVPVSFISGALVGLVLERGVIRFLYRRPLESLLATWGVSLVLQQLFRLTFGANNVQVYSPHWLSGNWTVFDVILGWNRVFVIGFAVLIMVGTWLLLNRTPLGLLIRAVMQNRSMASCMGVRTERVNMLTFAFGSGLAGLAGAFISQISNVGPGLGQNYIVDCFMTVVVGGVGNLAGTVISALGIGVTDQALQQILLNPVLGKILVLGAIILFLQWKPAGLFVTRGRGLES